MALEKSKKLEIVDDIIKRAMDCSYYTQNDLIKCQDDIKSYLRYNNQFSEDFIKRIDSIRYEENNTAMFVGLSDDEYEDEQSIRRDWEKGKMEFVGLLKTIRESIENYE
jgi:hypothetical protein